MWHRYFKTYVAVGVKNHIYKTVENIPMMPVLNCTQNFIVFVLYRSQIQINILKLKEMFWVQTSYMELMVYVTETHKN